MTAYHGTTAPLPTGIPDSRSKTCTCPLPATRGGNGSGGVALFGAQLPRMFDRDPLVLATAPRPRRPGGGVVFDRAWSVMAGPRPLWFNGLGKGLGFQYPSAVLLPGTTTMLVAYR